jgi:DNA polymerase
MGIKLSVTEAERHVETFRSVYRAIPEFWERIERAALAAMAGRQVDVPSGGPTPFRFQVWGSFIFLFLPSGRRLAYYRPAIQRSAYGPRLTYDNGEGKRVRIETRGSKLVENIVQAISRDVLVDGLVRAEAAGLDVVAHVHDEIIALAPDSAPEEALVALREAMGQAPVWAPKAPIRAAGWWGPVYRKD